MSFIVIEIQKTGETVGNFVWAFNNYFEAASKYHEVLAAAAVSQIEIHSAVLLNEMGALIMSDWFDHRPEPEPGPSPTPEAE